MGTLDTYCTERSRRGGKEHGAGVELSKDRASQGFSFYRKLNTRAGPTLRYRQDWHACLSVCSWLKAVPSWGLGLDTAFPMRCIPIARGVAGGVCREEGSMSEG